MITRPKIQDEAEKAKAKILCLLHYRYANGRHQYLTIDQLDLRIPEFNENIIEYAIESLVTDNLCIKTIRKMRFQEDEIYKISSDGILVVDFWSDDAYEEISSGVQFDESEVASPIAPASDRTVTPTDNQREEASQTLEDVIKEFRQDHHFDNEWAAEKDGLLKTLEAGREYLSNKVIDVRIGAMMTIEPLKEVVAKYDQAAVGGAVSALAQQAIELLMKLFGLG